VIIDVLHDALETPFLQRPYVAAGKILDDAGGWRSDGSWAIVLLAEPSGQDGEAQRIGTDGGVAIRRSLGRRKGIGKLPNHRVFAFFRSICPVHILRTAREALRRDSEAGSSIGGLPAIPILGLDGERNIEMDKGQRDCLFGRATSEFRSLEPTVIDCRKVDRAQPDGMIPCALRL
jgi:hypothetical protein